MPTEKFMETLAIQALKQSRLQHEFAWLVQASPEDLLDF